MKTLNISMLKPGSVQAIKKIMAARGQEVREGKTLLTRSPASPFVAAKGVLGKKPRIRRP